MLFSIGSDGYCLPNTTELIRTETLINDELLWNPTEVVLQALASAIELHIVLKRHCIWYSETYTLDYLFSVFKFNYLRLLKLWKLFSGARKLHNSQLPENDGKKWWFPDCKYTQVHEDEKSVLGMHMGYFKR